mmetsp:Transcript_37337/g.72333  ORF Transcript_37337/g.72333 Transcript_37337/m.72333 type:complete len:494 (+) Transcript_37337:27-1508(+)
MAENTKKWRGKSIELVLLALLFLYVIPVVALRASGHPGVPQVVVVISHDDDADARAKGATYATGVKAGIDETVMSQRSKSVVGGRVVFSYCLYGNDFAIRSMLENALEFLHGDSLIVVHISVHKEFLDHNHRDVDWDWIVEQNASDASPIHVNPNAIHTVHAFHGTILKAHLLNYKYAKTLDPNFKFFSLFSADSTLFRCGAENWIRKHKLSFGLGFSWDRDYNLAEYRKRIRTSIEHAKANGNVFPDNAFIYEGVDKGQKCYSGNHVLKNMMVAGDYERLQSSGLWFHGEGHECFNFYQHEGTFYPADMMDRFLLLIHQTGMFDKLLDTTYMTEEIWLPSYILKNEQDLLTKLDWSPPLISRFLQFKSSMCCSWNYTVIAELCKLRRTAPYEAERDAVSSIFGNKYQWPKRGPDLAMLEALWCYNDPKCDLKGRGEVGPRGNWILQRELHFQKKVERTSQTSPMQQLAVANGLKWPDHGRCAGVDEGVVVGK